MEAAARSAYFFVTGGNPGADYLNLLPVRGMEGVRSAAIDINGTPVRVAVVHGIDHAKQVVEEVMAGKCAYDFIEVMTCRGGCIGGGGQPKTEIPMIDEIRASRIAALYQKDSGMTLRFSHENPEIKAVYEQYYEKPLSELAERLLHTNYYDRSSDLGTKGMVEKQLSDAATYRCDVCGYEHTGDMPDDYRCPVCGVGKEHFKLYM